MRRDGFALDPAAAGVNLRRKEFGIGRTLDQKPAVLESDHLNFGKVAGVVDGRQAPHLASVLPRRIPDGPPAGFGRFDERSEFAGRHASRQGRGRIALRGRANRMERPETKRNHHPSQRAIHHHCLDVSEKSHMPPAMRQLSDGPGRPLGAARLGLCATSRLFVGSEQVSTTRFHFAFQSRTSRSASAISAGVINLASASRRARALSLYSRSNSGKREALRLSHLYPCT